MWLPGNERFADREFLQQFQTGALPRVLLRKLQVIPERARVDDEVVGVAEKAAAASREYFELMGTGFETVRGVVAIGATEVVSHAAEMCRALRANATPVMHMVNSP